MASSKGRALVTPPGTPPSPAGSLYDMSDDEEGGYSTIRHKKSGRGVKLLGAKSKVYVHPTPSSKDNIPGFIGLIQQKPAAQGARPTSSASQRSISSSDLLLAWLPESSLGDAYDTYVKVDLVESSSPPRQSYLVPPPPNTTSHSSGIGTYAFAVPVSEIYSLLIRPPSLGWWFGSLVINTKAGDSFPALFFHDSECQSTILQRKKLARENFDPFGDGGGMFWGGDEVLRWLKHYVSVERATQDPNVYLLDPSEEDKLGFQLRPHSSRGTGPSDKKKEGSEQPKKRDAGMDPVTKTFKEARWNFLEKLSKVTTFTRRTAQAVAEHPNVPPQVKRLMTNPQVQTLQEEFDTARIYLARWAMGIAEQSEKEKRQRIFTAKDMLLSEESAVGEFEILDMENMSLSDKRKPLTLKEWQGWFDAHGRLQITPDEVKERIFLGGLDANDGVRSEAWMFLLEVYKWDSSKDERQAHINSLRDEYVRLKGAWWERMSDGSSTLEDTEWWREQRMRIEKDVHRTDRHVPLFAGEDIPHPDPDSPFADVGTNVHLEQMKDMLLTYNEYNKSLGYVQGMSDLLSPIYAVMQDDAVAFWCFAHFMERMERNFLRDQSGMRKQLLTLDHLVQLMDPELYLHLQKADSTNFFFFFRFLLVWYKREFAWHDILWLWETLWTDYLSSDYHLFIALSILQKHRAVIIEHLRAFDEVLKYVNDLSGTIDLPSTLLRAEALFRRFQRTVDAVDKQANFPPPTLRQRKPASSSTNPGPNSGLGSSAAASGTDASSSRPADADTPTTKSSNNSATEAGGAEGTATAENIERPKIISPELRNLLSRKVDKMPRQEVREHGGGIN